MPAAKTIPPCKEGTIRNPDTNRCVKVDGKIGKKIQQNLIPTKSPDSHKISLKGVDSKIVKKLKQAPIPANNAAPHKTSLNDINSNALEQIAAKLSPRAAARLRAQNKRMKEAVNAKWTKVKTFGEPLSVDQIVSQFPSQSPATFTYNGQGKKALLETDVFIHSVFGKNAVRATPENIETNKGKIAYILFLSMMFNKGVNQVPTSANLKLDKLEKATIIGFEKYKRGLKITDIWVLSFIDNNGFEYKIWLKKKEDTSYLTRYDDKHGFPVYIFLDNRHIELKA